MKQFLLVTLLAILIQLQTNGQSTSGVVGTIATDPDAPSAETFNLKVGQKIELKALIHTRYQLFQDTTKADGFDLRRARLDFKGEIAPKFGIRIQAEMANNPKILDATFIYKPKEYFNVIIGQSKTPYCNDNYYSPYSLLTISRTQLDNALSNRESDVYGNNQGRDIGIWITGKVNASEEKNHRPILEYHVGVYNGSGINVIDNNNAKDFGAYLKVSPINNLWITGRAYRGFGAKLLANPDSTADRTRLGTDITYKYKRFLIEAEYLNGKDDGKGDEAILERSAFSGTIVYTAILDKLQFIGRIDNYDKDLNTELDVINKYILASSWYFNKNTRIQIEYDFVREEIHANQIPNDVFAIQFQAAF